MRADWVVLTQLKVVTGLGLSSLQSPVSRRRRRRSGQARQSRSRNITNQSTGPTVPPNITQAALVEWTDCSAPPGILSSLTVLCFLISARVLARLGGEETGGLVITLVISLWRTK